MKDVIPSIVPNDIASCGGIIAYEFEKHGIGSGKERECSTANYRFG